MAGRPFSTDDFFRLREPTFRVPMHLSPDGRLLSLTIRSRSHGTLERDQSFTPEGIPGEMVGSRVLVGDTQTGDAQTPFGPDATSWAGVWSPSGRLLAAYVQHDCPALFFLLRYPYIYYTVDLPKVLVSKDSLCPHHCRSSERPGTSTRSRHASATTTSRCP